MSILHPRHKMSGKNRYQKILLIFAGLIASGILMCSFLFSMGYEIYLQRIEDFETNLRGKIVFQDVVIKPLGNIFIRNISFFQNTLDSDAEPGTDVVTSDTFLSNYDNAGQYLYPKVKIKSIEVNFNLLLFVQYLFTPFEELPEHDIRVLKSRNKTHIALNYLTTKSLRTVSVNGFQGRITLPDDKYLLLLFQEMFFSQQILPYNMNLELYDINAQIFMPSVIVTGQNLDIDCTVSDAEGIYSSYVGILKAQALNQTLATEVQGILETTDLFANVLMEGALVAANFNNYATFSPLTVTLEKAIDELAFRVNWNDVDADIQGSIVDDVLDIALNISQVHVFEWFIVEDSALFSNINDDIISGSGMLSRDMNTNALHYDFELKSSDIQHRRFDIMLRGDENQMYIDEFFVDLNNQLIAINGDFSFQNFGINGDIKLLLDAPIVKTPISGHFNFVNSPSISIGTSDNFAINNTVQAPIVVEYSWEDKFVNIHLGDQPEPIVSVQQIFNTSQYVVALTTFPLSFLSSYYNLQYLNVVNEALIDAKLVFDIYQDGIQSIAYDIKGSSRQREYDHLYFNGVYTNNMLVVDQGRVYTELYDITTELRGSVDFSRDILKREFLNFSIDLHDSANVSTTYSVIGNNNPEHDVLRFNIADNIEVELSFNSSYNKSFSTLERVLVKSQDFVVPVIDYHITTDLDLTFSDLKINEIIAALTITTPQNNMLRVAGNFNETRGAISDIMIQRNEKIFEGTGTVYYFDTRVLQVSITETIPVRTTGSDAPRSVSITTPQLYDVKYDYNTKQLRINAQNAKLAIFTDSVGGIMSTNFLVDFENEIVQGAVSDSTIVLDVNKFNVSCEFFVSGFDMLSDITVSNVRIVGKNREVTADKILMEDFRIIESAFRVYTLYAPPARSALYAGTVRIDTGDTDTVLTVLDSSTPYRALSDLRAHLRLDPLFTDNILLKYKYSFNIFVTSKEGYLYITDEARHIDLAVDPEQQLAGTIGDANSILFAKMSGSVAREDLKINTDILSVDVGTLLKEFPNNNTIFKIDTMTLQGRLSIRGTATSPSFYGYVQARAVKGYMAFFDKDIIMPNITILISNNELSIVNSLVEVDKDYLYMNAKGRMNTTGLESMQADFFTLENAYIQVKQLRIAKLAITGEVRGKISLLIEPDNLNVGGKIYLNNALFSNEKLSAQQEASTEERARTVQNNPLSIHASVQAVTESGVIFAWPTTGFSILKAGFARDQSLIISYDGEVREFDTRGNLLFNSGTIYYLDKGFEISELKVVFDEFNGAANPYVDYLEAIARERYHNRTYTLKLVATSTFLDNLKVNITSEPSLSYDELSMLLGQNILPTTPESADAQSSIGVVSTLVKLSDPLSNIGIFSRLENLLRHSLRLDYLSFTTQIVQNLLEYTVHSSRSDYLYQQPSAASDTAFSFTNSALLPYLFDKSSIILGKYIDIIYLNLAIELNTMRLIEHSVNTYYDSSVVVPLNLYFNVELPTPFFDLTWSMDPAFFDLQNAFMPMNLLTISWQKKF